MRRRLALAIAGVAAAAVVLFAVPLALVLQRSHRDQALLRLQRDTIAATRSIDLTGGRDPIELPRGADRLAAYDLAGRRLAGQGPPRADALVRTALARGRPADRAGDGKLVVAVPVLDAERVRGAVRAERADSAAARATRRSWLALAALAAGVAALAALAAAVLGRRLARPLERVADSARRLGEGDFTARNPRSGVAEVDQVGAALDATSARLHDLLARERAFSADASHQLRTPLAALRLELEALQLRAGAEPELPAALAQVERLQATVDTLLAVARDAPRAEVTAHLRRALDELETRWRGPLAETGRALRVRVERDDLAARISPAVLAEVLDVLVANAHAHGAGEVTVAAREAGGSRAIDVTDEGDGIAGDPEAAFRRRAGGDGGGHGIGLALARSLVEAEGGRLVVTRAAPGPVLTVLLEAG